MTEKSMKNKMSGLVSSNLKWKKTGAGQHWTLRRSMRAVEVTTPTAKETSAKAAVKTPVAPEQAPAKRKSIRESIVSLVSSVSGLESKVEQGGELTISKVKIGGLEAYNVVDEESGARVTVANFGGTLCSFRSADGKERLFLSKKTKTDKSKPVRGGVPVVFPVFGKAPKGMEQHGFARSQLWELVTSGDLKPHKADGWVHLAMRLKSNADTLKQWPHEFEMVHHIRFGGNELETSLQITNCGGKEFKFQSVLHTYLGVRNLSKVTIRGLEGLRVVDKMQYVMPGEAPQEYLETAELVKISSGTDNVYKRANNAPIVVHSPADNSITEINFAVMRGDKMVDSDCVIWNPGMEKAARMSDFASAEYSQMLCIEPGIASREEKCKPKETWTITQNLAFSMIDRYAVNIKTLDPKARKASKSSRRPSSK